MGRNYFYFRGICPDGPSALPWLQSDPTIRPHVIRAFDAMLGETLVFPTVVAARDFRARGPRLPRLGRLLKLPHCVSKHNSV